MEIIGVAVACFVSGIVIGVVALVLAMKWAVKGVDNVRT